MKRIIVILTLILPTLAAAGAHDAYMPRLPTYTLPTFGSFDTGQSYRQPTYDPLPTYQWQPAPRQSEDWRQILERSLAPLRMSDHHTRDLERGNRAIQRNRITITACHTYSRRCLNELLSPGQ